MAAKRRKNSSKGVTLVEVIVVLVTLAILASMIVPAMTGWIDKTRDKACIAEMGEVRQDYLSQAVIVGYGLMDTAINKKALLDGAVNDILEKGTGAASATTYTGSCGNTCTVTYGDAEGTYISNITCAVHGSLSGEQSGATQLTYTGDAIQAFKNALTTPGLNNGSIDSAVPDADGPNRRIFEDALAAAGFSTADAGIQSWVVRNGGTQILLTDVDVGALAAGTRVLVLRYNAASSSSLGKFMVGYINTVNRSDMPGYHTGSGYYGADFVTLPDAGQSGAGWKADWKQVGTNVASYADAVALFQQEQSKPTVTTP